MSIDDIYKMISSSSQANEAKYIELRYEDIITENLMYVNGRVISIGSSRYKGLAIRVLVGHSIGFSSTDIIERTNIIETFNEAVRMAKSIEANISLSDEEITEGKYIVPGIKTHPSDIEWGEKLSFIKDLYNSAKELSIAVRDREFCPVDAEIKSITIRYASQYGDIHIITSEGRNTIFKPIVMGTYIQVVASRDGTLGDGVEMVGGSIDYGTLVKEIEKVKYDATWKAVEKTIASPPPAGYLQTIIYPSVTGLFAHESFGHMSEGDFIASKSSTLVDKIGEKIASDVVSIIDDGTPRYPTPIYLPVDDEGIATQKVYLVKDGIDNGYIHNRISAADLETSSTGNGRAQDYRNPPLVRMRNTFFGPGDWDEDEIIRESREGIIVDGDRGGQAELDGTFTFSASRGYIIENGEIKRPIRDIVLTGNILEMLRYIDAAGKNVRLYSAPFGACGKGFQSVFVGLGGPVIRVSRMQVGGKIGG
jgi:TldD protein